jgi:hypothetical protein
MRRRGRGGDDRALTVYNHPASVQHQRPRGEVHPLRQCQTGGVVKSDERWSAKNESERDFFATRPRGRPVPWTAEIEKGRERGRTVNARELPSQRAHLKPVFLRVPIAVGFLAASWAAPEARKHRESDPSTFLRREAKNKMDRGRGRSRTHNPFIRRAVSREVSHAMCRTRRVLRALQVSRARANNATRRPHGHDLFLFSFEVFEGIAVFALSKKNLDGAKQK